MSTSHRVNISTVFEMFYVNMLVLHTTNTSLLPHHGLAQSTKGVGGRWGEIPEVGPKAALLHLQKRPLKCSLGSSKKQRKYAVHFQIAF